MSTQNTCLKLIGKEINAILEAKLSLYVPMPGYKDC